MEIYEKSNKFINILKGVLIAVIFTIICLFIFSCLLVYTNISENLIDPTIIVITGISILLGSSIGNRKNTEKGFLNGAIVGLIYILLIYIASSIANGGDFSIEIQSLIMIAVGIIAGTIGGIIGVN